jgi:hypothetical protein
MEKIVLDKAEVKLAKYLAAHRYRSNRNNGVRDKQVGDQGKAFIDLNGVGGELAVAKALNVYPDLSLSPRAGGSDLVSKGKRIDVKTTHYPAGRLLAVTDKNPDDCDIFILVTGRMPEYEIKGWCYSAELINPDAIGDLGHGPTYALAQDKLRGFGDALKERKLVCL